jgi:hypothetical protein
MKRRKSFGRLPITWRGLVFYPLLVWLFLTLLKNMNLPTKTNIINETGLRVFHLLQTFGFSAKMAKLITSQAAHETGNFSSKIFKENNNLFGMKLAKKRRTLAIGEQYGHAKFKSIEDSVKDYKIYHKELGYNNEYPDIMEFVKALVQKNYFEANPDEYTKGVTYFYNLYFNPIA